MDATGGGCTLPGATRQNATWSTTLNQVESRVFPGFNGAGSRIRLRVMHPMDTGLVAGGERGKINSGTERLKSFLKVDPLTGLPRIVFSPHNKGVLSELGAGPNPFDGQTRPYKWKVDKDGHIYGDTPEDKNNHGLKAIIYGLVDRYGYVTSTDHEVIKVRRYGKVVR